MHLHEKQVDSLIAAKATARSVLAPSSVLTDMIAAIFLALTGHAHDAADTAAETYSPLVHSPGTAYMLGGVDNDLMLGETRVAGKDTAADDRTAVGSEKGAGSSSAVQRPV